MKFLSRHILSGLLAISLLSSCISSEEINYLQDIKTNYPLQAFKEYKLNVGDVITCNITSSDSELVSLFKGVPTTQRASGIATSGGGIGSSANNSSGKPFTIYEDSTIILPYFGKVKIVGLTIQQTESVIQRKVQESVKDGQVQILLSSNYFFILANDKKGAYSIYKENMTIYQALAMSEQTTGTMDLTKVSIIRKNRNGESLVKTFDLRSQDVIQSEFYYVQPNDVIYFPTSKNAFFNVTSLSSLITTVMIPVTFLVTVLTLTK